MKKVCSAALALVLVLAMSLTGFCAENTLTEEEPSGGMVITTVVPSEHKITVTYNEGGYVLCNGRLVPGGTQMTVDRFGGINLDVICDKDHHIKKIEINGEDVTEQFVNGTLTIDNVVNDINIEFDFEACADDPHDKCAKVDMEGKVYIGKKELPKADISFDFGSFTAKTDKNGKYYIENISDGRHIASISKDDENLANFEFVVTHSDDIDEVTVVTLPDGTQNILVPNGTDKVYIDFIIADDDGDGIPDVDPDTTDPTKPFNPDHPDYPDNGKKDDGVEIAVNKPKDNKPIIDIPNLGLFISDYAYIIIPAMAVISGLFFLLLIFKRRKDEEEDETGTEF